MKVEYSVNGTITELQRHMDWNVNDFSGAAVRSISSVKGLEFYE